MRKYQFFTLPNRSSSHFTYLEMSRCSFLREKERLLKQNFSVDGEPIYADNASAAIEIYQQGFTHSVHEYNLSNPLYALIYWVVTATQNLRNKKNE